MKPLTHVLQSHIYPFPEHLQDQWLQLPGQSIPVPYQSFWEDIFSNTQPEPSHAQPKAIISHSKIAVHSTAYTGLQSPATLA